MCHLQALPPHSLIEAHAAMNAKYPDDRFDIWPRMAPSGEQEWRVKCLDCPGKVRVERHLILCLALTITLALHSW